MNTTSAEYNTSSIKHYFTILGAGQFGSAMAHVILKSKFAVNPNLQELKADNLRFYDIRSAINLESQLEYACFEDLNKNYKYNNLKTKLWIITAVPAAAVTELLEQINYFNKHQTTVILVSKGTDKNGQFLPLAIQNQFQILKNSHKISVAMQKTEIARSAPLAQDSSKYSFTHKLPFKLAALTGPHFAEGLRTNQHTISAIACDESDQSALEIIFHNINPSFSRDVLGLQIISVMKNIAAYCCGLTFRDYHHSCSQINLETYLNEQVRVHSKLNTNQQECIHQMHTSIELNPRACIHEIHTSASSNLQTGVYERHTSTQPNPQAGIHETHTSTLSNPQAGIHEMHTSTEPNPQAHATGIQPPGVQNTYTNTQISNYISLLNKRAAMFGQCLEDTKTLLKAFNCDENIPPAALADWFLCCSSEISRNYQAGLSNTKQTTQLTESLQSAQALRNFLCNKGIKLTCLELIQNNCI